MRAIRTSLPDNWRAQDSGRSAIHNPRSKIIRRGCGWNSARILWYVAMVGKTSGFDLDEISEASLTRTNNRYGTSGNHMVGELLRSDADFQRMNGVCANSFCTSRKAARAGAIAQMNPIFAEPSASRMGISETGRVEFTVDGHLGAVRSDNPDERDGYRWLAPAQFSRSRSLLRACEESLGLSQGEFALCEALGIAKRDDGRLRSCGVSSMMHGGQ